MPARAIDPRFCRRVGLTGLFCLVFAPLVQAQALVYPGIPARDAHDATHPGDVSTTETTLRPRAMKTVSPTESGSGDVKPVVPAISGPAAAQGDAQSGIQYAILQGTNKVTARSTRIEVPIGTLVRFGNLEIVVQKCETSQPPARREQAALLDIWELRPAERPERSFYGWMFASSPSLSSLAHPVYDVTLLECTRKSEMQEETAAEKKESAKGEKPAKEKK